MANATIYRVLEALQAKTAKDFSAGYSGLDMRNSVILGALLDPPRLPYAAVSFIDYTTEQGLNLSSYRMQSRFEIYCFCGGAGLADRTKNVLNLTSDIIASITEDRFLDLRNPDTTRTIDNTICNFTAIEGDRFGLEGVAIGYIEVTVTFQSRTGV